MHRLTVWHKSEHPEGTRHVSPALPCPCTTPRPLQERETQPGPCSCWAMHHEAAGWGTDTLQVASYPCLCHSSASLHLLGPLYQGALWLLCWEVLGAWFLFIFLCFLWTMLTSPMLCKHLAAFFSTASTSGSPGMLYKHAYPCCTSEETGAHISLLSFYECPSFGKLDLKW